MLTAEQYRQWCNLQPGQTIPLEAEQVRNIDTMSYAELQRQQDEDEENYRRMLEEEEAMRRADEERVEELRYQEEEAQRRRSGEFEFERYDRGDYAALDLHGAGLQGACGVIVLHELSPALCAEELAFMERKLAADHYGLMLATTNRQQREVMETLRATGWTMDQEFYNPNSGNTCYLWHKVIVGL